MANAQETLNPIDGLLLMFIKERAAFGRDRLVEHRAALEKIASYPNTYHGELLAAFLGYEKKYRNIPTLVDLGEYILTLDKYEAVQDQYKELKDGQDGQAVYNSLDVLIGEVTTQAEVEQFISKLSRATSIAKGNKFEDHEGKTWEGVQQAVAFLMQNVGVAELTEYKGADGERDWYTGRDGTASFAITSVKASSVKPEKIDWLWPDRFPLGKLALLSGKPDNGKSTVVIDIASRVTTGSDWPDGSKNTLGPRNVIMAVAEDDPNTTLVPNLMAAGADLDRIELIRKVRAKDLDDDTEEVRSLQLASDVEKIRLAIQANPDVALITVDTLTSFFGDVNPNVDKDIRPIMDALVEAFRDCKATFLGVIHHNKKSDVGAVQKILGASSVPGAVRAVYECERDDENKEEFYFSLVKGNLTKKRGGMKYKIAGRDIKDVGERPYVEWIAETDETADSLAEAKAERKRSGDSNTKLGMAKSFLRMKFANGGAYPLSQLIDEIGAEGVKYETLKHARYALAKDPQSPLKIDYENRGGAGRGGQGWWVVAKADPQIPDLPL